MDGAAGGGGAGAGAAEGGGPGAEAADSNFVIANGIFRCKFDDKSFMFYPQPGKQLRVEESGKLCIRQLHAENAINLDPFDYLYVPETYTIKSEDLIVGSIKFINTSENRLIVIVTTYDHTPQPPPHNNTGRGLSSTTFTQLYTTDSFLNFIYEAWLTVGWGRRSMNALRLFREALRISPARKRIIGPTIRADGGSGVFIKIPVQEVRNYQDAISQEEISTKLFTGKASGDPAYVVLNLTKTAAEKPLNALTTKADGKPSDLPIKETIKKFTLLSLASFIRLAQDPAEFRDPRTRLPITSVHFVFFQIDEALVGPREAAELAEVSLKRPRTRSLGGGITYYEL